MRTSIQLTFALIAIQPFSFADSARTPEPAAQIAVMPDHTDLFLKLFEAGLPDTTGADFVKCAGVEDPLGHVEDFAPAIPGIAWRLPSTPANGGTDRILIGGIAEFPRDTTSAEIGNFGTGRLFTFPSTYAGYITLPRSLVFHKASLATELRRAHSRLSAWKTHRDMKSAREENTRSPSRPRADRLAPYLILAAHAHRAGLAPQAHAITDLAFSCANSPDEVTDAALSALADTRCSVAFANYTRTGDTAALTREMEKLGDAFGEEWKYAPAARHLLRTLAAPAAIPGKTSPAPSPAHAEFAAALLALREMPADTDWLCTPPATGVTEPACITLLRRNGVDAIPKLVALQDDATLTRCSQIRPPSTSEGYSWSNSESRKRSEADAFRNWQARPFTRGEIASKLLGMARGYGLGISRSCSASKASILADYDLIKREGRVGILLSKLAIVSPWQLREIAPDLITAARESDDAAARAEAGILASAHKSYFLREHIAAHLRARGAKAAPFFEKLVAASRADLEALSDTEAAQEPRRRRELGIHTPGQPATREALLTELDRTVTRLRPLLAAPPAA